MKISILTFIGLAFSLSINVQATVSTKNKLCTFHYTNPITRDASLSMRDHCIIKVGEKWYCTGTSSPVWTGPNPGVRPEFAIQGGYDHLKFQDTQYPYCETGHNALFIGPDGNIWSSCHYLMDEQRPYPYCPELQDWERTPQLGIEPVYYKEGRFWIEGPTWVERHIELK